MWINIRNEQFRFTNRMGTRETIICPQTLLRHAQEHQQGVRLHFIDYEKAFNAIRQDLLAQ